LTACNGQDKPPNRKDNATEPTTVPKEPAGIDIPGANPTTEIPRNILSIFQDKNDNYWFGTQGSGLYRYDGKTLIRFAGNSGLGSDQVQTIQQDQSGTMWFGTGGFGVSRFDGETFTAFTTEGNMPLNGGPDKAWKIEPGDLWFHAGGGAYRYNGKTVTYLPLPKTDFDAKYSKNPPNRLSAYAVYCTLKDKKGNLWFGTQTMGVCRYDGKSFTWFSEKGLKGPAVLGLFEDKKGNLWFGNNGNGLFRYDGTSLTNFTEEKGLSNDEFLKSGKAGPGTLARIYTINEDNYGDLWIGTVDAGVWRYDGKNLTNYTTKDGLPSNAVNIIYKDRRGELWFGTEGEGVCKFNGAVFTNVVF
jgi:ligand-binding sensor domain-containing protein